MKRIFLILWLFAIVSIPLFSQKKEAKITNIRMSVEQGNVVVKYDIENSKPIEYFDIIIYFSDEYYSKYYHPDSVYGDVGKDVKGGLNKTIIWEIDKDMAMITGNIMPHINFANVNLDKHFGGPSNALLSIAVPGLGDYFIANHKDLKFKPYYKTALSLGLLSVGIISAKKRYRETYWSPPHTETIYYRHYTGTHYVLIEQDKVFAGRWIEGKMKNYIFPGDAEAFIGLGAAIWLIDVLWVASKGKKNIANKRNLKNFSNFMDNVDFSYQEKHFQFKYVIKL